VIRIKNLESRFGTVILSFLLSFLVCSQAYPVEQTSISLPSELGRVDKVQTGTNSKTIILIQSAHTHYGAQKAIAEILRTLIEKGLFHLILVEGGWGNDSLSHLRSYAPEDKRLEVAERYLKEGKITGDEYLDLTSDLNMTIWGVENATDYRTNMEVFLKFYEVQDQVLAEIKKFEPLLDQTEQKDFPKDLLDFSIRKKSFQENKSSMPDYLNYLSSRVDAAALEAYPNLKDLIAVSKDQAFDSAKVEIEKKALMKALSSRVTKLELEQFDLLKERKTVDDEINYLKLLLDAYQTHKEKLSKLKVENLSKYLSALESINNSSSDQIFGEIAGLEEQVLNQFSLTEEQKTLIRLKHSLVLLKKLFSLEMTPRDYEEIKQNPPAVILRPYTLSFPHALGGNLDPRQKHSGMTSDVDDINFELIEKWIPGALSFYESARKREESLIQNTVQKINETQDQTVALLIGGFHSENMANQLHQLGYTVITISPRFVSPINSAEDNRHYFEILKYKWGAGEAVSQNLKIS